jgi:hypothetical protein
MAHPPPEIARRREPGVPRVLIYLAGPLFSTADRRFEFIDILRA